ncbi:MAG TPA: F0F1 ATP synthase subunit A [Patescibacteria group bacterium]|nr:F0F1 ATP synthase subunit A [Patescibacteria group bacterium]
MPALPPLPAEILFHLGPLPVSNTLINAVLVMALFALMGWLLARQARIQRPATNAPRGLLNFWEAIVEFLAGYVDNVTKDRAKTDRFLPIVGGIFLFILTSNWLGLLPGMSSIGLFRAGEFIPVFRSANTDLNLTLSMAVFAVIASHLFGVAAIGFFRYANKFIKLGDIWQAIKSGKPMGILVAIIEFFVGLIEIFSEVAKIVSLSLRLFGNIFAGEVLLTVLASLLAGYGAFLIPLPFMLLELIVGLVQATVFAMLTLVYLSIATTDLHGHEESTSQVAAIEDQTPTV